MTVYLRPIGEPFAHSLEIKEIHLSQVCVCGGGEGDG